MEDRIKPAIKAAQELAIARGNSAIAAVGYFSERRFNLRIVGLNTDLERTGAYWANRFSKTIRSSQPVNGCWVEVQAFGRRSWANELRELICSKIPASELRRKRKKASGSNLIENGGGRNRRWRFRYLSTVRE